MAGHAAAAGGRNAIQSIDVDPPTDGVVTLTVHLLEELKDPETLTLANVRIDGRRPGRATEVVGVPQPSRVALEGGMPALVVRARDPGDASTFTLRLLATDALGLPTGGAYPGFDPHYASAEFSFRPACPVEVDCLTEAPCPPPTDEPRESADYLAKDYASFRRLIFDRLAQVAPAWADREVPDLGVTVAEIMAYVGDYLSYYQDAVATEAYLDTARRRISVRRHARLVDYPMHDGCNARAWIHVEVDGDFTMSLAGFHVFTEPDPEPGGPPRREVREIDDLLRPEEADRAVFAPVLGPDGTSAPPPGTVGPEVTFSGNHNCISLRTWGEAEVCLPRGATSATLDGGSLSLRPGDVLIFEEVLGPKTFRKADADPTHRHAVRLTEVTPGDDPDRPFVDVEWDPADALPFPLYVRRPGSKDDISVARGNVVLFDHGLPQELEPLVPARSPGAPKYAPLSGLPLTHAAPFPDSIRLAGRQASLLASALARRRFDRRGLPPKEKERGVDRRMEALTEDGRAGRALTTRDELRELSALLNGQEPDPDDLRWPIAPLLLGPATEAMAQAPEEALPALVVESATSPKRWTARRDLLGPPGRHVAAEVDDEGRAHLRFAPDDPGLRPDEDDQPRAAYRSGNGASGNLGAEKLVRFLLPPGATGVVKSVRNPLPASGGVDPEPVSTARLLAPTAFRDRPKRAITGGDYARLAEQDGRVQRASGALLRTGTGFEARVWVDLRADASTPEASAQALEEIEHRLGRYRRIGHDVRVLPVRAVALDLELNVVVDPRADRGTVVRALGDRLGARRLQAGKLGMFHPDNLMPGTPIHASRIVSEAQDVSGVLSVSLVKLRRLGDPGDLVPPDDTLRFKPSEVARLDGDPAAPERGRLVLNARGGR